jgi:hypothetical protein
MKPSVGRKTFAEFEPAEVAQFARPLERIEARVAHLAEAENMKPPDHAV